jgi:hypothetical protein
MIKIEGAKAFLRARNGVYREVDVYTRGEYKYIPYGKGFLRLAGQWDNQWLTSHPNVKVLELEGV